MKKVLLSASIMSLSLLSAGAYAVSGTIQINGEVSDITCNVKVGGTTGVADIAGGDATLKLPTVSKSELTVGSGPTGTTPLVIMVEDCDPATGQVRANFDTINVNASTGNLKNNDASGAKNVEIQISNAMQKPINLMNQTDADNPSTPIDTTTGNATMTYYASYVQSGAEDATFGAVETAVAYTLNYQ